MCGPDLSTDIENKSNEYKDANKIHMPVLHGRHHSKFNSIKWYEENLHSCKLWSLAVGQTLIVEDNRWNILDMHE